MDINQYTELRDTTDDKIFGQFVGIVTVTGDTTFPAKLWKEGYRIVTRWNVRISKRGFIGLLNSSTGAIETGIEFKPLQDSLYNSEKLGGFFSNLKSNPDRKYIKIVFDADKSPDTKAVYVAPDGSEIGDSIESIKHLISQKVYDKKVNENQSVRETVKKDAGIDVRYRPFKIENIAEITINGKTVIDPILAGYLKYVKK